MHRLSQKLGKPSAMNARKTPIYRNTIMLIVTAIQSYKYTKSTFD